MPPACLDALRCASGLCACAAPTLTSRRGRTGGRRRIVLASTVMCTRSSFWSVWAPRLPRTTPIGSRPSSHSLLTNGCALYVRSSPTVRSNLNKLELKLQSALSWKGSELEVYSWGSNANFTLGIHAQKSNAEMVEYFAKSGIFVRKVSTSKFHSIFLASNGNVYTCGFGLDGRLGHGDECTFVAPKLVDALADIKVVQVAASRNNSYFRTADGSVYSCGSNEFKQLGLQFSTQQSPLNKSLVPRKISGHKSLKGKQVFVASRF